MSDSGIITALWLIMFAVIIFVVIICGIIILIKKSTKKPKEERTSVYQRKNLLTKNEYIFYKQLKEFANKNNLHILTKVRVADIVEPKPNANKSEWFSDFGKIKSKHVDFAIANKDNLYIICLIELDDNTHQKPDRIERDNFLNQIYQSVGIPIIHTKQFNQQTETQLRYILGIATEPPRA